MHRRLRIVAVSKKHSLNVCYDYPLKNLGYFVETTASRVMNAKLRTSGPYYKGTKKLKVCKQSCG